VETRASGLKVSGPNTLVYGIKVAGMSAFFIILREKSETSGSCTRKIVQPGMSTLYIHNVSIFIINLYYVGLVNSDAICTGRVDCHGRPVPTTY